MTTTDMILKDLFDRISKEDVVLFVGAGVSMSAGLPSGSQLSNIIFKLLPKEIQASLHDKKRIPTSIQ
ncbi:MAG: hypothetical protein R3Y26_06400 [Rikenellaceae bacterium]